MVYQCVIVAIFLCSKAGQVWEYNHIWKWSIHYASLSAMVTQLHSCTYEKLFEKDTLKLFPLDNLVMYSNKAPTKILQSKLTFPTFGLSDTIYHEDFNTGGMHNICDWRWQGNTVQ